VIVIASSTQRRQSLWLAMLRRRRHQLQITHSARDCALMARSNDRTWTPPGLPCAQFVMV